MNIFLLSWKYFWSKPLNVVINTSLFGLGIGLIVFLLIAQKQLSGELTRSSKGIDLVVGAKGSPMQLILSSIYHIDFPTGNIALLDGERLTKNRFVKRAVPLALGDAYNGARIVGTTPAYRDLYNLELAEGEFWKENFDVNLGSRAAAKLGMSIGDEFYGQHGLVDAGFSHDDHGKFKVVGILSPTGTAVDELVLTSVQAIWEMHEEEHFHHENEGDESMSKLIPGVNLNSNDSTQEVTSILIQYRSPMGAMQLPRYINQQTNMQSASPAFEMARLLTIVGAGVEVIEGLAYVILLVALLSIVMTIYNALKEREYDLAVMRALGATKTKLFVSILLEGGMMAFLGTAFGIVIGHLMIWVVAGYLGNENLMVANFYIEELYVLMGGTLLGVLVGTLPAISMYKVDVSSVLSDI